MLPGAFLGRQQQRVLLAGALCATDQLLVLDEPVTGLGPGCRKRTLYSAEGTQQK